MEDGAPARAVIVGAGPAGLTAAYELATRTDIQPVVLEARERVGGISCTIEHNGNRIDIGGHRFFSKSDRVMDWWLDRLPLEKTAEDDFQIAYKGSERGVQQRHEGVDPHEQDAVMLVRERTSRIYWHGQLYDYPLSLTGATLSKLGLRRAVRAGLSYLRSMAFPIEDETTLEDFLINRFGRELYHTFFKSYTEKVWGVDCEDISADWGAQRIRGLSIKRAIANALSRATGVSLGQEETETSLIERFLYPKFGPGQMWETVAGDVRREGGEIRHNQRVVGIERDGTDLEAVVATHPRTGEQTRYPADLVFSSMPIPDLVAALDPAPNRVQEVAEALPFRDFFTVGLLVDDLQLQPEEPGRDLIPDNWIYVQEPGVRVGRLQIFNNWSPWMVQDPDKVWLGLEYFCDDTDPVWFDDDDSLVELGISELAGMGIIDRDAVRDSCVIRMPKTYPAYFGAYEHFDAVRDWLDGFDDLFCVGRNGQHRYNNQDHSMLTSMLAVDLLCDEAPPGTNVWQVNTEQDYHEQK